MHISDSLIFNLNKYIFVVKVIWGILNWNHLREKWDVKTSDIIRFINIGVARFPLYQGANNCLSNLCYINKTLITNRSNTVNHSWNTLLYPPAVHLKKMHLTHPGQLIQIWWNIIFLFLLGNHIVQQYTRLKNTASRLFTEIDRRFTPLWTGIAPVLISEP